MVSLPVLARRTMSSYAIQNWRKSIVSAALMLGTSNCRDPSRPVTSMARPRLTCTGATTPGLPSTTVKEWFIAGTARKPCTSAYPIRWVNETFPPRPRARWLLITMRLSARSLAGMARTLVAVGTLRLAAMFSAVRAAAPRNRTTFSCAGAAAAADSGPGLPSGAGRAVAGWAAVVLGGGAAGGADPPGADPRGAGGPGVGAPGADPPGPGAAGTGPAGAGATGAAPDSAGPAGGGAGDAGAGAVGAGDAGAEAACAAGPGAGLPCCAGA